MKDDLLNSLLMITINVPAFKTAEYENLMEEVITITIDDNVDDQIETIDKKLQETIKNTEPLFRNEVKNNSDDDNDKDDDNIDSDSAADDSFWKKDLFIALDI